MENHVAGIIGVGALIAASLVGFVIYRWRQETRVAQIKHWVNTYLRVRYGEVPARLNIICSHDTNWPVIARYDTPVTGIRHSLQFMCPGKESAWFLLSEKDEQDVSQRNAPIAAA